MKATDTIILLLILSISACNQLYGPTNEAETEQRVAIARAGNIYLYHDDLVGLLPKEASAEDSAIIVRKYIDQWMQKQLIISRATQELEFDEASIERKVLDYRYALMAHEYEKYYVNQNLNKKISEKEIQQYYDEKFENFVLRQNIVRCLFAIIPLEAPKLEGFRRQLKAYPNGNLEEIQSYCYRFASNSSLETDLWLEFDEMISNTPISDIGDKVNYLKNNYYVEAKDEQNYYFIRLLDYKISGQVSPLEYIHDDIESILINKKKVELRKQLEQDIMTRAKNKNEIEIY